MIEDELIGHPDVKNSPHRAVIEYPPCRTQFAYDIASQQGR